MADTQTGATYVQVVLVTVLVTGMLIASASGGPEGPIPIAPADSALHDVQHVVMVVFENHAADTILGRPDAPAFATVAAEGGVATRYTGVAHPSQPNYFALWSGTTHGARNDPLDLDGPTIADQLEAAGLSWRVAAEHVPPGCYRGAVAEGGRDGPGTYVRRHEPAISFHSVSDNPARCARIGDLTSFDPAAADFWLVVPDLCHDLHDCGAADGNEFLARLLDRLAASPTFAADGLLIVTFDEAPSDRGGAPVTTILAGPAVKAGARSAAPYDHYSALATIEAIFGLPCLRAACEASPMVDLFG